MIQTQSWIPGQINLLMKLAEHEKNHRHHNIVKMMVDCILFHLRFDYLMQSVFGTPSIKTEHKCCNSVRNSHAQK
jgi:uncharacterized membrane protein